MRGLELLRALNHARAKGHAASSEMLLSELQQLDCQSSEPMREYWVKRLMPGFPTPVGCRWALVLHEYRTLEIELRDSERKLGCIRWSRGSLHPSWQALHGVGEQERRVGWGTLQQCAQDLAEHQESLIGSQSAES